MSQREIEDIYPLSPMQQGMLFHTLYAPETGIYFEQTHWVLRGRLDSAAFTRAAQRVFDPHSALRTTFLWEGVEEPLQVVYRDVELPIERQDWRGFSPAEQEARLEAFLRADREQGFDLSEPPLMRFALLQTADDACHLVWSHHHLLLDGWSTPQVLAEIVTLYEAFSAGRELSLDPVRPFRDYIVWLQRQDVSQAEAFWRRELAGFTAPTSPGVDRRGPEREEEAEHHVRHARLTEAAAATLHSFCRRHQLTLNTLFQGVWALLLSRYSGEEDVLFGAPVSGRPASLPGAETIVGLFINTLPVRVRVPSDETVLAWLKALQETQAEVRQYEYASLVQIQGWSEVPRDQELFESLLVFENYPKLDGDDADAVSPARLVIEGGRSFTRTNYPLTLAVSPGDAIGLEIHYDSGRFDAGCVERMLRHLRMLLEDIAADPEGRVGDLSLLTEAERHRVLVEWNATEAGFPADQCIHELFEAQAARAPGAIAVTFEDEALSYAELNRSANRLAHHLRSRGVGPETLVGIALDRSPALVVAILGVLKAGGAYLPLDPSYPIERLAFMIEDAQVPLLITHSSLRSQLWALGSGLWVGTGASAQVDSSWGDTTGPEPRAQSPERLICLDEAWATIEAESEANPGIAVTPEDLAYCIYTSGSTGRPKGTLLGHRGLVNLATWQRRAFALDGECRVLQFAPTSFDASVWETVMALANGATLCLAPQHTLASPLDLARLLRDQQITHVTLPPTMLALLPEAEGPLPADLPHLRVVVAAGEACSADLVRRWAPGRAFYNAYGPTETTVCASYYRCDAADPQPPPIGRPIANTRLYVLDGEGQPVPVGVAGELYIGGAGVARGYLNRPELTAEKFVTAVVGCSLVVVRSGSDEQPTTNNQQRLYRTGDRARWLADGNLEFLGRIDQQVKVRGFRIELGEVEAALKAHPEVRDAAVTAREDRLVAYIVATNDQRPTTNVGSASLVVLPAPSDQWRPGTRERSEWVAGPRSSFVAEVRDHLKGRLPEYMVPSAFVMLDALPLSPSGKVDRKALPELEAERSTGGAFVAPRTPVEDLLAGLFAQVLGLDRVGIRDRFFEMGGHSLLATSLVSRVRELFGVELPLRDLFDAPTVAALAGRVETLQRDPRLRPTAIEPAPRDEALPLSFAQQRLWFLEQLEPGNLFYNIPLALRLEGALDVWALERSLNGVVARHEALRTTFAERGGLPIQVIAPELPIPLPVVDLRTLPEREREREVERLATEEARTPFDLSRGPLLRALLLRLGESEYVAILVAHHVITDGWSMGLLIGELAALYEEYTTGVPAGLPELPIQYGDYSRWQREWLTGEVLAEQLAYWTERLRGAPPVLALPLDRPRSAVQSSRGAHLSFTLPGELSRALRELSREEGVTLYMTLLAAFQALLYRYSGQVDVPVGTPIAGRNRAEIEGLIGFFVNTLVMRTDLSGEPSGRDLLARVREVTLGAYAHPDLPFEMLVEALQPDRSLSHTPLFQVMFVLDSFPRRAEALPGLTIQPVAAETGTATFDLTLSMTDEGESLGGYFELNTDLFDVETIDRMRGHFERLLAAIVADPDAPVSALPLLTEPEERRILVEWNDTRAPFAADACIHHRIEAWVARQPEAPALMFEGETVSYGDLNRRAEGLARRLRERGVGPDVLVGIATERSFDFVIALLAAWKTGGAYLPLDPTYPRERLAFMLEDSKAPLLLTQSHLRDRLPEHGAAVLYLDEPADEAEAAAGASAAATPENLAYCIYTSGSTGRPKGTLLGHRGLVNLAAWQQSAFDLRPGCRVLQFAPTSFDASVWETVMALANGATLCLAPQHTLASPLDLARLLRDQQITHVTLPPTMLALLPEAEGPLPADLPHLRVVVAAGEACSADLVRRWAPGRAFYNAYGPTETTVCASYYRCDATDPQPPPIGRPIANTRLYVLDGEGQPVPVGVAGELYIGGAGVARGYLNRPELTAEKFVTAVVGCSLVVVRSGSDEQPTTNNQQRLYRTGDRARWLADGNLEFLGRIDQQVKVRGFRIELGEVEAALKAHDDVRDAAVAVRETASGDPRLVAYVVAGEGSVLGAGELRAFVKGQLPEYMVPELFVELEALPLNASGKVDRAALPAPGGERPILEREYVAPRNELETRVAAICAELLGLDRVGVEDSFFELGGHSLLATQLVSRLREAFHADLPLRILFEHPTVVELAEYLLPAALAGAPPPAPTIVARSRDSYRVKRSALETTPEPPVATREGR